jgi:hypothetical protein
MYGRYAVSYSAQIFKNMPYVCRIRAFFFRDGYYKKNNVFTLTDNVLTYDYRFA